MRIIRIGVPLGLLLLLILSPAFGRGEGERAGVQERLREVLLKTDLEREEIEATIRAVELAEWEGVTSEGVESILPALGYAKREGTLPEEPRELEAYARALSLGGSELTRLGFTSREAAHTLAEEVRRMRVKGEAPRTPEFGQARGAAEAARRAQRRTIREEVRDRLREVGRDRAGPPGSIMPSPDVQSREPPVPEKPVTPAPPDTTPGPRRE